MKLSLMKRSLDAGNCTQYALLKDGIVVRQWLEARQGHYTGGGNPDWIGKPKKALHGTGMHTIRKAGPQFEAHLCKLYDDQV